MGTTVGVTTLAVPRPAAPPADPTRAPTRHEVREEIQALRAIAVLLVVLFHLWPNVVPGGFVGVDVFFAISGFLITGALLREVERRDAIWLTAFWARRARRLLPAALLVVLACAVATVAVVPLTSWGAFFAELRASTAYVQNWHLSAAAVDYFAADDAPSPVRHFWSLSAEEQFYLVWPLVIVAGLAVSRRRPGLPVRRAVAIALVSVTVLSLLWSTYRTIADPAAAYFATPTRAWEFGAGGVLALLPAVAAGPASRAVLSWVGLGAIALAAFAFTEQTAFPGWAALLPVGGALAVMRAGTPARAWAPTPVLRLAPVQRIGDLSYSIYLWHWPLLVLAPFALGQAVGDVAAAAILAATIGAAWLTKRFVEDPVRAAPALLRRPPRLTLAVATLATLAVVGVTVAGSAYVDARIARDAHDTAKLLEHAPRCFGAASRDPARPCVNPALRAMVVPTPVEATTLANAPCRVIERDERLRVCAFGAEPVHARATVAVLGDSHASHWRPALDVVARARRWRGLSITRTGCPFSLATPDADEPVRSHCAQWNRQVLAWFGRHPEVRSVLVAAHAGGDVAVRRGQDVFAAKQRGYADAWGALPRSVGRLVVLRDTPKMPAAALACVQDAVDHHRPTASACAVPRRRSLQPDPQVAAATALGSPRVRVIDLTAQLCDARWCFPVVGGALAFKDADHLTPVFAATLGPVLARAVRRTLPER
jgi:peptidoglycan/LPS O-acetylase OafA/YrhL